MISMIIRPKAPVWNFSKWLQAKVETNSRKNAPRIGPNMVPAPPSRNITNDLMAMVISNTTAGFDITHPIGIKTACNARKYPTYHPGQRLVFKRIDTHALGR